MDLAPPTPRLRCDIKMPMLLGGANLISGLLRRGQIFFKWQASGWWQRRPVRRPPTPPPPSSGTSGGIRSVPGAKKRNPVETASGILVRSHISCNNQSNMFTQTQGDSGGSLISSNFGRRSVFQDQNPSLDGLLS